MGPGIDSQQVLEMSNFGPAPLAISPGLPICQFVFQRLDGDEQYQGRFAGQSEQSF
jgi:dCTP deaminase